jgi:nicotinamidase-related amidase
MTAALVLIDLQKDLCLDPRRRDQVDAALPAIQRLIAAFHAHGRPIVFTRFELDPDDPQFARFGDTYCVRGTPGAELIDAVDPALGQVVAKVKHSAFYDTDLEHVLRQAGADTVVLGGLQTQICILTTAADAYNRGFRVIVAREATVSTHPEVKLEGLDWIAKYVGEVQSVDTIVGAL